MNKSSKNRLTDKEVFLFTGDTLFDKVARTVCRAGCLPRKELFESWEVARRIRRRFRGGRVVELACGHGLLSWLLLLLDDSSPHALAVDRTIPKNSTLLMEVMTEAWPRLAGRISQIECDLQEVPLLSTDLVVSVHACGGLTDLVLQRAADAGSRVAVLPCCHDIERSQTGGLLGWMENSLAVDATRAATLRERGYSVLTQLIPEEITPCNRLLMGKTIG